MTQTLAYQVGAIFAIAAALMILSLMRDWIPAELRKAARYAVGGLVLAIAGMAAYRAMPSVRWPSFGGRAAASSIVREPIPALKGVKAPVKPGRPRPKIREISPEEAARLMEQIRNRKEVPIGR